MAKFIHIQLAVSTVLVLSRVASAAPPPIEQHLTENGLTVLVVENHASPLVTIEIAVKNGSMTESPEFNGLSHLYEHMFFKANKALPSQEAYLARVQELGMLWNGTTNTERVNYFFTITSNHLDEAMVFMRDAIVSPLFDEKELAREREVVVGELERNFSTPGYHLWHDVQMRVFWKFPSYKRPLGDIKSVRAATQAKMKTIQERYYLPNNSVLVVAGDVHAKDIFARSDELYKGWKRGPDPFIKFPLVKHPPIERSEVVLVEQPVGTVQGEIVWHGPSTVGKDVDLTFAADVLSVALGEPSSRFQKALVDSGACLSAGLDWYTQMNTGPITLRFQATATKADACVKTIVAELPKMKEPGYLSDAEMKSAAQSIEIAFIRDRETSSRYAHNITFWWTSAGLDYYLHYVDNVKKATQADIVRYLDSYVLGKNFVFGAMVSPDMVKQGLTKEHFASLVNIPVFAAKEAKPASAQPAAKKVTK